MYQARKRAYLLFRVRSKCGFRRSLQISKDNQQKFGGYGGLPKGYICGSCDSHNVQQCLQIYSVAANVATCRYSRELRLW